MAKDLHIYHIRNFCIIAHIDHGKSTLADRILELTGAVDKRLLREQLLDDMDLERERGITIKASCVRLDYKAKDGKSYLLNLIDTPGHVDFSFEVSRALAACEGAILLVDAVQGVEAQTVANLHLAREKGLTIIPVINKIDLSQAEPERVKKELHNLFGMEERDTLLASAKEGSGIQEILERVIRDIPPPQGDIDSPLQAMVFDSDFDMYRGVIVYLRVVNGQIRRGQKVTFMSTGSFYEIQTVGFLKPTPQEIDCLRCGEVGFVTCNIRNPKDVIAGDTLTLKDNPCSAPLQGYKRLRPMVYCGIYPANSKDFERLRDAIEKLALNDSSFVYETESSGALGFGFRCGFLGLLHMEIIQERLEREYDLNLVITSPSVVYKAQLLDGGSLDVDSPTKLPPPHKIKQLLEPYVRIFLLIPVDSVGSVMELANNRRGRYKSTEYLSEKRVKLTYELPLSEILVDFYDRLKSITKGYGSMDYEFSVYIPSSLIRLDILINGQICEPLSCIVHKELAYSKGKALVDKLKELIPRQLFEVVLQAAIGERVIARESIRPLGKHVTGKCYGGDITRKRKLWEKQKMGKKRMKQFGSVEIPQEAFLAALKI